MAYLTSGNKKLLGYNTEGKGDTSLSFWQPNTTYKVNDLCLYKETNYYSIYICVTDHTSVDAFVSANWKQLTYAIDELTKEEIEAMTDLILDTEVRIDKTYSSSKIYSAIQQCLNDSKTFTLLELGKFSGVSYKIVASTSEMTSETFIYLLANGNTYDMYVVEENGATTKIGDTNVNLSDYYTKTETDNDFLKKTDANGKYATITTVDGKIDKDKIVTALDNTATDEQVASALLTKTELDKTNAKLGDKADKSYVDDNFATMDKVTKFPDWSNQLKIKEKEITLDQDVYIELSQLNSEPIGDLKINGKDVSISDFSNGIYSTKFNGYVKKGSVVSYPYLAYEKFVRVFPLV